MAGSGGPTGSTANIKRMWFSVIEGLFTLDIIALSPMTFVSVSQPHHDVGGKRS